ncbi:MAG: DUF2325 domain-containing protein [Mediterraneibacter gnavus]
MTEWSVSIKKYVRNISVKQKCSHRCQEICPKKIGTPDLVVLFTNTVSHKMVRCAVEEAGRCNAEIIRCHTSSKNALEDILETACAAV